jgi:ComF family protein
VRLVEHFFRFIAPYDCLACDAEGSLLCEDCAVSGLKMLPSSCYRCTATTHRGQTCRSCNLVTPLSYVWTRTTYNTLAKALIHSLKFEHAKSAADTIALELATVMPRLQQDIIIVHLPAATTRVRERGYDQSALIARSLSRHLGNLHVHALKRMGQQRQVGTDGNQRRYQMKDSYRVVSPVRGARVLLVDDVLTTGSTLEAAASALMKAGVTQVLATTFAKAVR